MYKLSIQLPEPYSHISVLREMKETDTVYPSASKEGFSYYTKLINLGKILNCLNLKNVLNWSIN